MPHNRIRKLLFASLLGSMSLTGCGVHNPFCGSARPVPVLNALAPNPASFAQVQQGLLLTVNGSHFYSESIVVWNGEALSTIVVSSTQLQTTVTTTQMPSPGSAQIVVHTPPNLAGDLGCDSGGDSQPSTFTVTE
jgi:IPT/TIG domain